MRRDQYSTPPKPESEMTEKAMKSSSTVGGAAGPGAAADVDGDMIGTLSPAQSAGQTIFGGGAQAPFGAQSAWKKVIPTDLKIGLFSSTFSAYIDGCRGNPDMAINGRRNKPIGPGGSTRRLHQNPNLRHEDGLWRGRNRIDEGVKGVFLLGMVPPLSGLFHSCQRQLCSGCSGCVTQSERPNLKS